MKNSLKVIFASKTRKKRGFTDDSERKRENNIKKFSSGIDTMLDQLLLIKWKLK